MGQIGVKGIITLTTDFGIRDPYVGAVKGVILSINPFVNIIDITHEVYPQDIIGGAFAISQAYIYFPAGSIHVCVVDPGVGGERNPIAIKTERYVFVGPDNGIFSFVLGKERVLGCITLTNRNYFLDDISPTFHGRDIFAPAAAYISKGVSLYTLGIPVDNPVMLDIPEPSVNAHGVIGEVLYIDRFGNIITNIRKEDLKTIANPDAAVVSIKGVEIGGIAETYVDAGSKGLLALIGSSNHLEIACFKGSASDILGVKRGECVEVKGG